ncbi:conserved hypothetical protein [methanotrophic bacterial endosymbiont of Bathymodiolus sp.]|nr:conserved hypothetical protein [methanotrophic bacterial endosymbiont of Bathymodiolus sp.]
MNSGITLRAQEIFNLLSRKFCGHAHGKGNHQAWVVLRSGLVQYRLFDGGYGVFTYPLAALAAMQVGGASVNQLQVIIDFSHCAHGAAGGAHGVGLIDGNGGQHAFNAVYIGFVHAVQKLACIGRKGFNVAALPFGIQGIEHQ